MLNILDGNALGNAHHAATRLSFKGMQTQAVYGYVRMMREMLVTGAQHSFLVLWDGRAKRRFELLPTYKIDREQRLEDPVQLAQKNAYRAQVPVIRKALTLLGFDQLVAPDFEADDIAGLLVKRHPTIKKRLITGDGDWLQLIDDNCEWYDPRKDGKRVTHATFHESTGYFTPTEFLQGKALQGDTSDSIPGVGGIGEKGAALLLAEHRSVEAFFAKVDAGWVPTGKKLREFAATGRQIFERNMQLMDLRDPDIPKGVIQITEGFFEPEKFHTLCSRLGFASITRSFSEWIKPFNRGTP